MCDKCHSDVFAYSCTFARVKLASIAFVCSSWICCCIWFSFWNVQGNIFLCCYLEISFLAAWEQLTLTSDSFGYIWVLSYIRKCGMDRSFDKYCLVSPRHVAWVKNSFMVIYQEARFTDSYGQPYHRKQFTNRVLLAPDQMLYKT